jgi:molecular chaperone DnaK
MTRQTVDFGIDLGTTNSAIARSKRNGVEVIKNGLQSEITPSAVARDNQGKIIVGSDALQGINLHAATRFKRMMGTTNRIEFGDGTAMLPEELSAEVLKELKASVEQRFSIDLDDVVITVPAMFEQPQCEATHRAASLAGMNAVALLQEPIAAATAYLNDNPEEGDYMVYDLGGGTFDVSIVRLRDGQMTVIAHGGDNYLGGSDFDRHIRDWAINQIERVHGPQAKLKTPAAQYGLLRACEEAKKRLGDREQISVDIADLALPIDQLTLTKSILEDLIEEPVSRSIRLSLERLSQTYLEPDDIRSVFLVGGPTQMPYIRRRLREELGIQLSAELDPMTVVAEGAAIHASSLLKPDRGAKVITHGERQAIAELYYAPVSPDINTTLSGKIVEPAGFSGEIRVSRASGNFDTGWIPLRNGAFSVQIQLERSATTDFLLTLRSGNGQNFSITPPMVTIRNGVASAPAVTPYNYGVSLGDGSFSVIVAHGEQLPAVGVLNYQSRNAIQAGSPDELKIYFLEGMSTVAEDNVLVGSLSITGTDLQRNLRAGERIDIRINMDESRRLKARVSVPLLDLEFPVEMKSIMETPNIEDMSASYVEARESLSEIEDVVQEVDEQRFMEVTRELERIEADIERMKKGEKGAAEEVAKKLQQTKAVLRPLEANYSLKASYEQALEDIEDAERIAVTFDARLDIATLRDLRTEADRNLRLNDDKSLKSVSKRAKQIFWSHYQKSRECWIGLVEYLRESRQYATDYRAYDDWTKRAYDCLERQDFEGVRLNAVQAMTYLPDDEEKVRRFADSGIIAN